MKHTFLYLIMLNAILVVSCTSQEQARPNVILVLTDDQGAIDINAYGATDLITPGLDRLFEEGIHFSRFYVASALCSPSRAAIMTGLTPHSAGAPGNLSSIPGIAGMPAEKITLAEVMKNAGYTTGHVGKWHLGYSEETMPLNQGFDYSFGHMGGCIDNYSHFFYWNGPNRHDLWENGREIHLEGEYFPELMASKVEEFIVGNRRKPFFLYYAINIPHYPLQPPDRWRERYTGLEMPRRDYAGFVSMADENIGRMVDLLDRLKIRENTVIVFLSDHGHSYEERAFGGGGNPGPFRGGKSSLFEGGIRVPAIISWKGHLEAGATRNQVCHSTDLLPTIAALCGITDLPPELEGVSLAGILADNSELQPRTLYWKLGTQWAVRQGSWKLVGRPLDPSGKYPLDPENDRLFLVNLDRDSTEGTNLAAQHPEMVDSLIRVYLGWKNALPKDIAADDGK